MSRPDAPERRPKVLVCDDNDMVRAALTEVVRAQHDLDLAGSAADADESIRLAIAERPHVVVLDVRLPGGGRYAAQEIIRAVPGVRILVFSAYGDLGPRAEMAAAGVSGYLVKGITNAQLLAEIRTWGAEALAPGAPEGTADTVGQAGRP
ncbi:response regulator transcription factor [Streptomyces sp. NPDC051561]|uniref:response regulator transcription factor n=1 Tax=Streptomyces sp. NPDC051561 TaxID=3365658 RepID=UPI0037AF16B7